MTQHTPTDVRRTPHAKHFGLIMNVDGDDAFTSFDPEESRRALRAEIDRYARAGVNTIVYTATTGSEVMLYPSAVGVQWGWRATAYDQNPQWTQRVERNKVNQLAGSDALRTVADQCVARGMKFVPALRMNDAHFAFAKPPEEYPLTGPFWLENRDLTLGQSPVRSKSEYRHLLDFSHEKVREHRLAQVREVAERYADTMAGLELDFARFQLFFPPGAAPAGTPLLTDFVTRVRGLLDRLGEKHGRRYALIARTPPSLRNCTWSGMDVEAWMRLGLVDIVVPSLMMTTDFSLEVGDFLPVAAASGAAVYACLMPRVGWRWEHTPSGAEATRDISPAQVRGAGANMRFLGADGLYLFNFQHWPTWKLLADDGPAHQSVVDLAQAREGWPMVFSVTKANWQDHEDTYEYRKQLPMKIAHGETGRCRLLVGVDEPVLAHRRRTLRVGLRDVTAAQGTLTCNGVAVFAGRLADLAVKEFAAKERPADLASHLISCDAPALRPGWNEVAFVPQDGAVELVDAEAEVGD